ncbi:phage gp45-like [Bradyrhizobium diazoefficiens]|uniref:phage baseplate assembly protein domain-containing protein n=1 Tax=Bradyrhizobium TaxID=374 RepID=UPI0009EA8991|nr:MULTISPECIES: phage baseplate assembly protein [Bradyrhizobium]MBR0940974.1 phage baseplate assembly protein [Bradyrhizobium liaoningense]WLA69646.1 phage baseplate assembly protein [Bradyrhizobium diazoefficiens]
MHRATPLNSSLRGYSAGGARGVVDQVDDSKLMQEMGGNFMANETRSGVEAPQNYGFTSVVFDAEKDALGKIKASAEHFSAFIGGSRSFPVAGSMDDRRHRLFKLEKGDTAMFRGRGDKQQFHLTQDGGFWSAPQDKTVRMHLLQQDSESNATIDQGGSGSSGGSSAGGQVAARDAGGGSSGGQQGGQQQKRGQQALYKDGQKSPLFVEVTKDKTRMGGNQCHLALADGNTYLHCHTDKQVYVGAEAGKASFDYLVTLSGPCVNSLGKIG